MVITRKWVPILGPNWGWAVFLFLGIADILLHTTPYVWQLISQFDVATPSSDLAVFQLATKAYWLQGLNPYQKSVIVGMAQQSIEFNRDFTYIPFLYNPLFLFIYKPASFVSFQQLELFIFSLNVVFLLCNQLLLYRLLSSYLSNTYQLVAATLIGTLISLQISNFAHGTINNLLAFCLLGGFYLYRSRGYLPGWAIFVSLILLSIKPQWYPVLLFYVADFKALKRFLWAGFAFASVIGLCFMASPPIFNFYGEALQGKIEGGNLALSPQMLALTLSEYNASLSGAFYKLFYFLNYMTGDIFNLKRVVVLFNAGASLLILVQTLVLLWLRWKYKLPLLLAATAAGMAAICFGPVTWVLYFVIIYPLLLISLVSVEKLAGVNRFFLALVALVPFITYFQLQMVGSFPFENRMLPGLIWVAKSWVSPMFFFLIWLVCVLRIGVWFRQRNTPESPLLA